LLARVCAKVADEPVDSLVGIVSMNDIVLPAGSNKGLKPPDVTSTASPPRGGLRGRVRRVAVVHPKDIVPDSRHPDWVGSTWLAVGPLIAERRRGMSFESFYVGSSALVERPRRTYAGR
jgi:hypothetical protein